MPTVAYSYARFSSVAQSNGDSERRQLEDARRYAAEKGFALDESLGVDRGLSGFSGENLAAGVLGEFVRQARGGKIAQGSVLIVENPDRISRQKFAIAYARFYQPVLEAGIEIHFVSLRCVLKPNHSFVDLLQVGVEMDRATSESAAKSERLGKAWAVKKHLSPPGIVITGAMPAWLKGKVGEPIRVNEHRAETVRLIFKMAAGGMGKRLITRRLNEKKIPAFGAEQWGHSTVQKILFNRAVLGEYQPMKGRPGRKGNGTKVNGESLKRVPDGEPRVDFFPAIVSADLWNRAHNSINNRRLVNEKGQTISRAGGRNGAFHNLFAGLVTDGNMNLPMHWRDKGKRDRPKLSTSSKDVNGKTPNTIPYADFEAAFLTWLDELDWASVIDAADSEEIKALEAKVGLLDLAISRDTQRVETIIDSLIDLPSPALKARLAATESALAAAKLEREEVAKRLETAKAKHRDLLNSQVVYSRLAGTRNIETRSKLRLEIRRRVKRVTFWFRHSAASPRLVEDPAKELFPFAEIRFVNGKCRYIVLTQGVIMTLP
jgi:DNA invertase Pin-like site-specific DNA recombinase